MESIDPAATAWLLASTALVLLMTPGLAIFYGGMVRATGVLNMIMMSFISIPLVTVVWLLAGYSLAFTTGNGFVGGLSYLGMAGIGPDTAHGSVPELLFATFQLTFAIITAALISGAIADRAKFAAWMVFVPIWALVVYCVVAHWVWGPDGWLFKLGALDYAGGLVVEIVSGSSALALALVLGPRIGFKVDAMRPHNLPFVLLGVGLLWFGWFGFNAGSALEANGIAGLAFINTWLATAAAAMSWLLAEWVLKRHPSLLGAASGAVAGLVAITPACGFVGVGGALVIGLLAGLVCLWGVTGLKKLLGADDALDVFGVHGVGGILGALLTGVFAAPSLGGTGIWDYVANGAAAGYSIGSQVWIQAQGVLLTVVVSSVVSVIAYKLVDLLVGLRVDDEKEVIGLDVSSHGERAYND